MRKTRWIWLVAAIAIVAIGVGAWRIFATQQLSDHAMTQNQSQELATTRSAANAQADLAQSAQGQNAPTVQRTVPVRTQVVPRGDVSRTFSALGTIRPKQETAIIADVPGRVRQLHVEIGDWVEAGDLVVSLDDQELRIQADQAEAALKAAQANLARLKAGARPAEIEQVEAQVRQARANFEQAEIQFERVQALYETGAATRADLDQVETGFEVAQAALQAAESQLALVRQGASAEELAAAEAQVAQTEAGYRLASLQLSKAQIQAPITAAITDIPVNPGDFVGAGTPVAMAMVLDPVVVRVEVGGRDVVHLHRGQDADVRLDAFPGRTFDGEVAVVEAAAAPSGLFGIRIEVPNEDGALRAGMSARVNITVESAEDVLYIPETALVHESGSHYVYVARNGAAAKVPVELGLIASGRVEIASGLEEGDQVIISDLSFLSDGHPIRVTEVVGSGSL